MRIAYIVHGRFPTEKAHGFQIAQVCDAMMTLGHEVTVLKPEIANAITDSPKVYYNLRNKLNVEEFESKAWYLKITPGFLRFAASMIPYGRKVVEYITEHPKHFDPYDLIYLRSPLLLKAALSTDIPVIIELHSVPRFLRYFKKLLNRCDRIVCLTSLMRKELVGSGADGNRVCVEADAVDLQKYDELPPYEELRSRAHQAFNIPLYKTVIGYVGSLVTREILEKGVRELVQAAAILKKQDRPIFLWVIGGPDRLVNEYRDIARSLGLTEHDFQFAGFKSAHFVPDIIAACDVCVYPVPKTDHPYFLRDTSPLKLFEYLAAARPIVCADLPTVRDVVDEKSVRFFRPGDPSGLAEAIDDVMRHPEEASRRAEEGRRIVKEHSWEKRMSRILRGISVNVPP